MNPASENHPKINLRFGLVAKPREHLLARVKQDGRWYDLARLAPAKTDNPEEGTFVLQYLVAPRHWAEDERHRQVEDWIRLYLIEIAHPAPWAFLRFYTTTTANVYNGESGDAHWTLVPATPQKARQGEQPRARE
jgi:hypothetical protein